MSTELHRLLCVDDEPNVVSGLERNLRRICPVVTATSGAEALSVLRKDRAFSVIISDVRMPEMDGAQFLTQARLLVPDAVRILLTGEADLDAVIKAVNDGNITMYLRKPVDRGALQATVQRAFVMADQAAEARERLQTAVRCAVQAALELARPHDGATAARAERTARLAMDLGEKLGLSTVASLEMVGLAWTLAQTAPARTALRALFNDELFTGIRGALDDLWNGAPDERSSVMARVVRSADRIDTLLHAGLAPDALTRALEAQVDARMLAAFRALDLPRVAA